MQSNIPRLQSIDALRGLVMILMALDHVRDFFSYTPFQPTEVTQASAMLFMTRWITHLCAPTFIFLSGISIYMYSKKVGDRRKTSGYLLKRGALLIVLEILLISFILTQGYQLTLLSVIWAIGCSMILLAGFIWLPHQLLVILTIAMIAGHQLLPAIGQVTTENMIFAFFLNTPFFVQHPPILVAYSILPWFGVMLLGYIAGPWFTIPEKARDQKLIWSGMVGLALFVILRWINLYGDPTPWSMQARGGLYTMLSFINVTKSPPSLQFIALTLAITCLLMVILSRLGPAIRRVLVTFGRVPLFYFILHLALISFASYLWTYLSFGHGVNLSFVPAKEWPSGYHASLWRTYFIWVVVVSLLYIPCKWYAKYKTQHRSWWVSYV